MYQMAERDVLCRFDSVRDVHIQPEYRNETYKQLILPVYATAYDYKGRQYTVLVNGQTGSIRGGYPKSPLKIALLAAAAVAAFILIYLLMWGDELQSSSALPGALPQVAAAQEADWMADAAEESREQWAPVASGMVYEWPDRRI